LEIYIFIALSFKLKNYSGATLNFMVLFLFVLFLAESLIGLETTRKSIFDTIDIKVLDGKPVDYKDLVTSKLLFIYLHQVSVSIFSSLPILLAFCYVSYLSPINYFIVLFYPLLIAFAEVALIGLILIPYSYIYDFLKNNSILQIAVATTIVLLLCYAYSFVLNIFVKLIQNQNLENLFTANNLRSLSDAVSYFIPVNYLSFSLVRYKGEDINYFFLVTFLALIVSLVIITLAYGRFNKIRQVNSPRLRGNKSLKLTSQNGALLRKEFILLTRDSSKTFSFTSLVILEPFLMYLVISSINLIFSEGALSFTLINFPYLKGLIDLILIMYFVGVINSGGVDFMGQERETMKIVKTIPVSPMKQILTKFSIPFFLSLLSLVISLIVLVSFSIIDIWLALFSLFASILFIFGNDIISLFNQLKHPNVEQDSNVFFLTSLFIVFVPLILFAVGIVVSYFGVSSAFMYLILVALIILLVLPFSINYKKRLDRYFLSLEVIN
jgi:hypothetical protein